LEYGGMNCTDCTRAASTWNWHGYRGNCPDCEIRAFASGPFEQWQTAYDQFLKARGREAADEIERRVKLEYKRIKALKGNHGT
jgi:hypothetical protein